MAKSNTGTDGTIVSTVLDPVLAEFGIDAQRYRDMLLSVPEEAKIRARGLTSASDPKSNRWKKDQNETLKAIELLCARLSDPDSALSVVAKWGPVEVRLLREQLAAAQNAVKIYEAAMTSQRIASGTGSRGKKPNYEKEYVILALAVIWTEARHEVARAFIDKIDPQRITNFERFVRAYMLAMKLRRFSSPPSDEADDSLPNSGLTKAIERVLKSSDYRSSDAYLVAVYRETCLDERKGAHTPVSDLYSDYCAWLRAHIGATKDRDWNPHSLDRFSELVGFERSDVEGRPVYSDVGIRDQARPRKSASRSRSPVKPKSRKKGGAKQSADVPARSRRS